VASGRLRRGKLHGLIAINGILSNDPKSYCQNEVVNGLGFVGHFKDGVPHGVCWRGLVGGAWIYGLVNEDGHFTGNLTAFVWKHACFKTKYAYFIFPELNLKHF
jgi:hypothetical protein